MNIRIPVAVLAALAVAAPFSLAYSTLGTKWGIGPGPGTATHLAGHEGTPGFFSFSVMGGGLGVSGYEDHDGILTGEFGMLLGGPTMAEEMGIIFACFATWAAVADLHPMLAPDGGVAGGAADAIGGGMGDIRIGVIGGFDSSSTLAHAYLPGTETLYGPGGSLTGDLHMNIEKSWVDDPFDDDDGMEYDLYTVLLHEIGHALGLGHSDVVGSVMAPFYDGGKRALTADDIAGIKFIYGSSPVPEPASLAALGVGVMALARRRRTKPRR